MAARKPALAIALVALSLLFAPRPAPAASADWDDLGAEFCRLTVAGDMVGLGAILTNSLIALIEQAAANPELPTARTLFQTYSNEVSGCTASTRSVAIVDIRRQDATGTPAWTDQLVVVPEMDGTTRIDDVLFASRKSDTLRARLKVYAGIP